MTQSSGATWSPLPESHLDSLRRAEAGYFWHVARVRWALRLIEPWRRNFYDGTRLHYADIGCGMGGFARDLQKELPVEKGLLVDGDPRVVDLARGFQRTEGSIQNLAQDWRLPWAPSLVTCMDVMEHLPDDAAFLSRLHAQMQPGGLLVMSVPSHRWLFSDWDRRLGHFRRYGMRELKGRIEAAGFRVSTVRLMWSFLVPPVAVRRFRKIPENEMEFPKVAGWINKTLLTLSDLEWQIPSGLRPAFGTSLIVSATRG